MKKLKLNFINIFIGLFFITCYFIIRPDEIIINDLSKVELTIKLVPIQIKGYRSQIAYVIESVEHKAKFQITKPGAMAAGWDIMKTLRKGDVLNALILKSDYEYINNNNKKIKIYSLQRNAKELFSVDDYNKTSNKYYRRWRLLFVVLGLLLFARGIDVITSNSAWVIAIICALVVLFFRWKNIWW